MDRLDFLTEDELIGFFHCKKTEISCIEEPHIFLNQLRDYDLVPEELYKKVIKMRNKEGRQKGVYEILNWLEDKGGECMKPFWSCVFKDHIQQKYPILRLLQNSLLDGSFKIYETFPNAANPSRNKEVEREEKKKEQKKGAKKRKKTGEKTDEEEPGPSSVSSQKKPKPTLSQLLKKEKLPVTCGDKEGTLYPDKLARGGKCIVSQDVWYTPVEFERFSGRGSSKNWKRTICYQNTPLQKLLKEDQLQRPHKHRDHGQKCHIGKSGGNLVCCDKCPRACHHHCH